MAARVPFFLALTVSIVANVIAIALGWTSVNHGADGDDDSDMSITGILGSILITVAAVGGTFMVGGLTLCEFFVVCDLDFVDNDTGSLIPFMLRLNGFYAIMSLVGAGLLIAALSSSGADVIEGSIAVVAAVFAICSEIALAWVGTPEDKKEAFMNFCCKKQEYARIDG